jgi:hypothetical protein
MEKIENVYRCGGGVWRKFSDIQKIVYNDIRSHSQRIIVHPKTELPDKEWETISHNFACLAAWVFKGKK